MSQQKKRKLNKYRILFSEVLPYEIPIIFNLNQDFFIKCNSIANTNNPISSYKKWSIPYQFSYTDSTRKLSIIHPIHQKAMVEFYDKYAALIIYYCSRSKFSIRAPQKVAKTFFYDDKLHINKLDKENKRSPELVYKEYEQVLSYFSYKGHSNIHSFYESYTYRKNEKKFTHLLKFDVSKCFDSLYTHAISWAVVGDKSVYKNKYYSCGGFADVFDCLMRCMNYGETHGIVIGPEFSRIFAEIIFQDIDVKIEQTLFNQHKFQHNVDYALYRYIDDYFLFTNEHSLEKIESIIKEKLSEYKLSLNESKRTLFTHPIITPKTVLKSEISKLIDTYLIINHSEKITISFNSDQFITKYKSILYTYQVSYEGILGYSFSIFESKITQIFTLCKKNKEKLPCEINKIVDSLFQVLDTLFFLFNTNNIQYSLTIKISIIIEKIIKYKENIDDPLDSNRYQEILYKKIYDELMLIINKNKHKDNKSFLWGLLPVLKELGENFLLDQDFFKDMFSIEQDQKYPLDYFGIISLLFYIGKRERYKSFRDSLEKYIITYCEYLNSIRGDRYSTELDLLCMDCSKNPNLTDTYKTKLNRFISGRADLNFCNIDWNKIDIVKNLDKKRRIEVY